MYPRGLKHNPGSLTLLSIYSLQLATVLLDVLITPAGFLSVASQRGIRRDGCLRPLIIPRRRVITRSVKTRYGRTQRHLSRGLAVSSVLLDPFLTVSSAPSASRAHHPWCSPPNQILGLPPVAPLTVDRFSESRVALLSEGGGQDNNLIHVISTRISQ